MKTKFTPSKNSVRTIFLSPNQEQINNLYAYLIENNFTTCHIKIFEPSDNTVFSFLEPQVPFYYIMVSPKEQEDAFEVGKCYAVNNNFDDVICCYPNFDFDSVASIKKHESGFVQ